MVRSRSLHTLLKEIPPMKFEFLESKDGSHTIYLPELDETYHSRHGAVTESTYVFIEKGLDFIFKDQKELTVLEVGFGTGLNALLTLIWAKERKIKIDYHTLEPFPLPEEVYLKLNYPEVLNKEELRNDFLKMHSACEKIQLTEYFSFIKYQEKLEDFSSSVLADIIFYDAFAPSKQKEIWSLENMRKCFSLLKPGGALVTYCANGQFKRDLKEAGFTVEVLQGPPGKKEMTRGRK